MTLDEKIEYSINLLRKSEEMALRMDLRTAFIWLFLVGKTLRSSITLPYRGGEIQGSHEPYERGPT